MTQPNNEAAKLRAEGEKQLERVARLSKPKALAQLKAMDPIVFEHLTAALFAREGYTAEATIASGDEGIDVIATKNFRKAVIQCKRYDGSVGQPVIRDLYGTMIHNQAHEAYLVTTATITKQAQEWAQGKPIRLVDGYDLVNWIARSSDSLNIDFAALFSRRNLTLAGAGLVGLMLLVICGLTVLLYSMLLSDLPPIEELRARQFQFQTTTIFDRNGDPVWEINDPNFGRRIYVTLDRISPYLLQATIATEDRNFYRHAGIDPLAILRAIYYNVTEGTIVSGASTITQQVARNVLMTEEERLERSFSRKVREAILAVKLANQYSRDEILEIYVNQIYYGNLAYGIEAAAQTYFGKEPFAGDALPNPMIDPEQMQPLQTAAELSLAEAALLAGLPQSPAYHDPYKYPDRAKRRQETVLGLMVEAGYITEDEATAALQEPVLDRLEPPAGNVAVPHFASYVLSQLEANPPAGYFDLYQAGLQIQTTLDPYLQEMAEEIVARQVDALAAQNVTNGALVALDPQTGQILAMVGSKDFWDRTIAGQINMAVAPRQPGSSIKPFVYLAAFENGWTANTIIFDEPKAYPDGRGGFYEPTNYDQKFHGPVTVRTALANSYNIPAVEALNVVGVPYFVGHAPRYGITSLTNNYYGLALALGAAEIPLLEMTGAYQALANQGKYIKPQAIAQILDSTDEPVSFPQARPRSAIRAEFAYIMTDILADAEARTPAFGRNNWLNLSRPAAAKTGTTNDFRDNLVLGYTPNLVVGVWVGNADYSPMRGTTGLSGAGPIWHEFMERAHEGLPVREFNRPEGVYEAEVCRDPRIRSDQTCTDFYQELFAVPGDPIPTPLSPPTATPTTSATDIPPLDEMPTIRPPYTPTPTPIIIPPAAPTATFTPPPPPTPTESEFEPVGGPTERPAPTEESPEFEPVGGPSGDFGGN